ncbi:myotubularin-related protein 10-A-like isoform X2 [Gigantopelta aegis]|uniref:myotubularin-related protein 10-A-like isoform X2 n=1 Tax=Gigantopelta aegis TaxID=1735272 RepID=UPI001B88ADFF|nr:myotubularin-related protein 10-A-like isoform X2 [Gigantopelta aegis]
MSGHGRFKSYLNQYEVEMKEKGKATFKSYIDDDSKSEEGVEEDEFEEVERSANDFFDGFPDPGNLFKGERVIAHADRVLKFAPYSDRKQGLSGHLFVTNFKIAFLTADRSSYEPKNKRDRCQLIGEHDIPLTKVDCIYQVVSGGKKKKLLPGNSVSNLTKYLEIHCKDLQIHTFGFKFCPKEQKKTVTNAIVHHAYPTRADLLFAYDYGHHSKFPENRLKIPLFFEKRDWEQELKRLNCSKDWRVADVNHEFSISMSLPEYFVVPTCLLNADLIRAASQFHNNRFPTWSFTYTNGANLVRMSQICPESEFKDFENKMLSAVRSASAGCKDLVIVDLSKQCPSVRDLQSSFDKLKDICMSDCLKDFISQEMAWYSSLENSQWLLNISRCFQCVANAVNKISIRCQSVVLKEESGCDMCCVVSSLVQLCLDPHCRTQAGFESLVQREWVVMGHPFHTRLGLSQDCEGEQAPVFLFFLDCIWQLLQQFPSSFAFTETYLTTLWDSVHLGLFETFLFNNCHQRCKFMMEGRRMIRITLPSVWDWKIQFNDVDLTLFNNPLYVMKGQYDIANIVRMARNFLRKSGEILRNDLYKMKLSEMYNDEDDQLFPETDTVLVPQDSILIIKLWTQCYLRWNVPAQIVGGGNPSQYLQQCLLAEEVIHLQHRLKVLQMDTVRRRMERPKSDLIFSFGEQQNMSVYENRFLTSSFPFSSGATTKNHQAILVTPLTCYLENSTITNEYSYDDD